MRLDFVVIQCAAATENVTCCHYTLQMLLQAGRFEMQLGSVKSLNVAQILAFVLRLTFLRSEHYTC